MAGALFNRRTGTIAANLAVAVFLAYAAWKIGWRTGILGVDALNEGTSLMTEDVTSNRRELNPTGRTFWFFTGLTAVCAAASVICVLNAVSIARRPAT